MNFPVFDQQVSTLNLLIRELVEAYRSGAINSWEDLDGIVKEFFTPELMDEMETLVPGWKKMASYSDGITLTHVICVFMGLCLLPEYQDLPHDQQQLAKWIVLFHDLEKEHLQGQRDLTHGFRGATNAAHGLKVLGFHSSQRYAELITPWTELTNHAVIQGSSGELIQDNQKLPAILQGIDALFEPNTPAALIVRGVLLHMSIDVVQAFPQAAPLTDAEIRIHVSPALLPLLKVMLLADNEGWVLFESGIRKVQRNETLAVFQRVAELITIH